MPYILYKTNGNKFAVIDDASADVTTSLTFVGKNYSGYGQAINENFLKLLESFSNPTAPTKPLQGQIWFNSSPSSRQVNFCYDGKNFKSLANIHIQSSTPSDSMRGDLWWDSFNGQLKTFNGTDYLLIGPLTSDVSKSSWQHTVEYSEIDTNYQEPYPIIKGKIGYDTLVTISEEAVYSTQDSSEFYADFKKVVPGITIAGADPDSGISSTGLGDGYLFWGTAANALTANTATTVSVSEESNGVQYLTFVNTTTGDLSVCAAGDLSYNATTGILYATSISAQYADLAERYEADAEYSVGTVLVIGGDKEVTVTHKCADVRVAGVVSTNPAYTMNEQAGNDVTHPYIALKGRVPCKVVGPIYKGDLLVTSNHSGYAQTLRLGDDPSAVIGKALETFKGFYGVIEVKV